MAGAGRFCGDIRQFGKNLDGKFRRYDMRLDGQRLRDEQNEVGAARPKFFVACGGFHFVWRDCGFIGVFPDSVLWSVAKYDVGCIDLHSGRNENRIRDCRASAHCTRGALSEAEGGA